jgi:hypothetical protein
MVDDIVRLDQLAGFPVMEVAALVADGLVGFRPERHRFASTVAALLAPRYPSLATSQIGFGFAVVAGGEDGLPVVKGSE